MMNYLLIVIFLTSSTYFSNVSAAQECMFDVCLSQEIFGFLDNNPKQPVHKFIWKNKNNVQVEILSYGVTLNRILVPDKNNRTEDVLLGYNNIEGYTSSSNPYFGATVGRVANRIANGQFKLDGVTYNLTKNLGNDTIHGGTIGFNKHIWDYSIQGTRVVFTFISPDGDQGFPGGVLTSVIVVLTASNELIMEMIATTTKKTPINLTNHAYFNLGGQASGPPEILKHVIQIESNAITETNNDGIPNGKFLNSDKFAVYDFRNATQLSKKFAIHPEGFDNNYCINGPEWFRFMASAYHPPSGRTLEIFSNKPGCQFFTAGNLPSLNETDPAKVIIGKNGTRYTKFGAFCFEPQAYPDSVNHANFPNTIVSPGEFYSHKIIYRFGVVNSTQ